MNWYPIFVDWSCHSLLSPLLSVLIKCVFMLSLIMLYTEILVSRIPDCSGLCKLSHIILYAEVSTCWVNCSYLRKHCHHNGTLDCSHKCHHLLWLHTHILTHQLLHCTLALCSIISCQCTGVWGGRWHVDIPQCYQLH